MGSDCAPSYQKIETGGWPLRAGKLNRMEVQSGNISDFMPEVAMTSADDGAPSSSAMKMTFMLCGAMSPRAPLPKSHQPRQEKGW